MCYWEVVAKWHVEGGSEVIRDVFWKGILGPAPFLSLCFPAAMMQVDLFFHMLLPLYAASLQVQSDGTN